MVVVPRRSDGGRRDVLWDFCRRKWSRHFPGWPIVEGHHAEGPFNRSKAVNDAARDASFEVLLIVDGDVWADPAQIQAAVDRAAETGRMTLAYTEYRALDRRMTDAILDGFDGDWGRGRMRMKDHCSSIVAVPAALWDEVGGFDERIEGHGPDDRILAHTCRVLGGGIEHIPGIVYHLEHPKSPEDDRKARTRVAGKAIYDRLAWEQDPAAVRQLVADRSATGAVMVVTTHGRRECIADAIPSALGNLKGIPVERVVISDDSDDIDYQAWLRLTFPDADLVHGKHGGFGANVRRAWAAALADGRPWVMHVEDDFTFNQPIDLRAMADVIEAENLLSMCLLRQPWFQSEIEAGGVVEAHPELYEDRTTLGHDWLAFPRIWTNPMLLPRRTLVDFEWPKVPNSEARMGQEVQRAGRISGYWTARGAAPTVTHDGPRQGTGY